MIAELALVLTATAGPMSQDQCRRAYNDGITCLEKALRYRDERDEAWERLSRVPPPAPGGTSGGVVGTDSEPQGAGVGTVVLIAGAAFALGVAVGVVALTAAASP